MARASINKKTLFISNWTYKFKGGGWNSEMLSLGVALCGAETWTLRKADQKYLESSEIWCWRRMEKISWTDREKNEEMLQRVEERNVIQTMKRRKVNCMVTSCVGTDF